MKQGFMSYCNIIRLNVIIINVENYIGQKFNYLTVLSQFKKDSNWFFHCRCDCGKEKDIHSHNVRQGTTKTCGSYECTRQLRYGYIKDCVGKKFYSLTILSEIIKGGRSYFHCRCDCGREKVFATAFFFFYNKKTCGEYECRKKYINKRDYTGQKFAFLTVLSEIKEGNNYYFICRCDCGRVKKSGKYSVLIGTTKTCGSEECKDKIPGFREIPDNTGKKFGKLTVLSQFKKDKEWYCNCKCDCGRKKTAKMYNVFIGFTRSCGCEAEKWSREGLQKVTPVNLTRAENSSVFSVLINMGYAKNGRKIGVAFRKCYGRNKKSYYKWCAFTYFMGVHKSYYFNSYSEALEKRLQIQKKVLMPFIRRNKKLLPKYVDIDYWLNLNSHKKFNVKKYENERIAGKTFDLKV